MTTVNYQNPGTVNLVLDSETIGTDAVTGQPLVREFVIPEESISGQSPDTALLDLMQQVVDELKKIRVLLEQDVPPGISEDVMDESTDASGTAEENWGSEGLEEY